MSLQDSLGARDALLAGVDGDRIAQDITAMMGKPLGQGRNEIATMAQRAEHMMAIAADSLADTEVPGREGFERRIERTTFALDREAAKSALASPANPRGGVRRTRR